MTMQYTGYICGNFTSKSSVIDLLSIDEEWQPIVKSEEERFAGYRLYQQDYYDFCYLHGDDLNGGIRRHILPLDKWVDMEVGAPNESHLCRVHIVSVELYQAPFNMVLFSIRVEITTTAIGDILEVMNKLRYASRYAVDSTTRSFFEVAIKPILCIYDKYGIYRNAQFDPNDGAMCRMLVEHNNKFRVFQVIAVDEQGWREGDTDKVLFELGSMSRVGSCRIDDIFSPSDLFFRRTIDAGRIDIFSNWKGLALNDTYTMVGYEVSKEIREYQLECIFEMFYVSQLFVKNYLVRLNNNFKTYLGDNYFKLNRKSANKLQNRYDEFECKCWFDTVTYSMLPTEIYLSMGRAMGVEREKARLYETIMRQNMKREKLSDQRMNRLLFFMTCLTMSSAIWDACCLLNEMYPFGDAIDSHVGFRIVTYALLFIIFVIMYVSRKR